MQSSIGVNLRVTAHSNQGGRKYMEDMFCVAYQPTADDRDLLYAYFGIFDGHGGREAAIYAKHHLMDHIVQQKNFWSDDDDLVLRAIRDGFLTTHYAMWKELDKWPRTPSGHPSTSGTTASIAFVRRGKLYIGHVGDSGIVLGYEDPETNFWKAKPLTRDHKPEGIAENARITQAGGKVVVKSGVPRVVWNRPRGSHKGPVRRSTTIDEIPFLAVARSLGDLWSYNSELNVFVVSPEPDVSVLPIDVHSHRCLILGTDGLWNMLSPQDTVNSVYFAEKNNEKQPPHVQGSNDPFSKNWINPSKRLVDRALDRWVHHGLRADNTSVVCVVVDPPGPPKVKRSHVIRHSCSTQDVASSPVGMSRYYHPEPEAVPSSSEGARGDGVKQRDNMLTPRPRPPPTGPVLVSKPIHSSTPRMSTGPTSGLKSQPSSRTTRVSRPPVARVVRRGRSLPDSHDLVNTSMTPPPQPSSSAFCAVSFRTLRESHRNELSARHESPNVPGASSAGTRNSSNDDVQIHEVSSSTPQKVNANEETNHVGSRKRKGQNVKLPEKKAKLPEAETRRPATRHSVAQGLLVPIERRLAREAMAKKAERKKKQKADKNKTVLRVSSTDNQKVEEVASKQRGVPVLTDRSKRVMTSKMKETRSNQKANTRSSVFGEKSDNHKKAGLNPLAKNAKPKSSVTPVKVLKSRLAKKSASPLKLTKRNLRSSKMAPAGNIHGTKLSKVKATVVERSLRSTSKISRASRNTRK